MAPELLYGYSYTVRTIRTIGGCSPTFGISEPKSPDCGVALRFDTHPGPLRPVDTEPQVGIEASAGRSCSSNVSAAVRLEYVHPASPNRHGGDLAC